MRKNYFKFISFILMFDVLVLREFLISFFIIELIEVMIWELVISWIVDEGKRFIVVEFEKFIFIEV